MPFPIMLHGVVNTLISGSEPDPEGCEPIQFDIPGDTPLPMDNAESFSTTIEIIEVSSTLSASAKVKFLDGEESVKFGAFFSANKNDFRKTITERVSITLSLGNIEIYMEMGYSTFYDEFTMYAEDQDNYMSESIFLGTDPAVLEANIVAVITNTNEIVTYVNGNQVLSSVHANPLIDGATEVSMSVTGYSASGLGEVLVSGNFISSGSELEVQGTDSVPLLCGGTMPLPEGGPTSFDYNAEFPSYNAGTWDINFSNGAMGWWELAGGNPGTQYSNDNGPSEIVEISRENIESFCNNLVIDFLENTTWEEGQFWGYESGLLSSGDPIQVAYKIILGPHYRVFGQNGPVFGPSKSFSELDTFLSSLTEWEGMILVIDTVLFEVDWHSLDSDSVGEIRDFIDASNGGDSLVWLPDAYAMTM